MRILAILRAAARRWQAAIVGLLLAVWLLGANPLAGQTVAPLDLLMAYPAWASLQLQAPSAEPVSRERSDVLDFVLPSWSEGRRLIRDGKLPVWLHASRGSSVGIQLPVLSMLTPSFVLFALSPTPGVGLYLAGLAKVLLAGGGMYLFMRMYVGRFGAAIAAVSFAACGFNTGWFFWPQVTTSAWLPWLFWTTAMWDRSGDHRWLAGLAFSVAMLILGGFPSVGAFCLYAWALWAAWLLLRRLVTGSAIGLVGINGLLLGAATILGFVICAYPLYEMILFLEPLVLDYRGNSARGHLSWPDLRYLFTPLAPDGTGRVRIRTAMYVGLAGPFLALIAAAVPLLTRRWKHEVLFLLLLLSASGAICFGLFNDTWLTRVPVFDSNPWGRMLVVFGFALAGLAGIGAHLIRDGAQTIGLQSERSLAVVGLLLLGLHTWDMGHFFRGFNAVVPGSWYYPSTPVLSLVQERLEPGQSVIADVGYMVGGTLGPYSIPEWFAHRHATDDEVKLLRNLVSNAFRTKTAASFPANRIKQDSTYFQELGVRYLLVSRPLMSAPEAPAASQPIILKPGEELIQPVFVRSPMNVSELNFKTRRLNRSGLAGSLYDRRGRKLFAGSIRAGEDHLTLAFGTDGLGLRKGMHRAHIRNIGQQAVVLLSLPEARRNHQLKLNDEPQARRLLHRFNRGQWRLARKAGSQYLYELTQPTGPYVAAGDQRTVVAAQVPKPGLITAQIPPNVDGSFVWPSRLNSSWRTFVNGQPTDLEYRHGVLLSTPVKGGDNVQFKYPTGQAALGLGSVLLGLLLCGGWFVWYPKRARSVD